MRFYTECEDSVESIVIQECEVTAPRSPGQSVLQETQPQASRRLCRRIPRAERTDAEWLSGARMIAGAEAGDI